MKANRTSVVRRLPLTYLTGADVSPKGTFSLLQIDGTNVAILVGEDGSGGKSQFKLNDPLHGSAVRVWCNCCATLGKDVEQKLNEIAIRNKVNVILLRQPRKATVGNIPAKEIEEYLKEKVCSEPENVRLVKKAFSKRWKLNV